MARTEEQEGTGVVVSSLPIPNAGTGIVGIRRFDNSIIQTGTERTPGQALLAPYTGQAMLKLTRGQALAGSADSTIQTGQAMLGMLQNARTGIVEIHKFDNSNKTGNAKIVLD